MSDLAEKSNLFNKIKNTIVDNDSIEQNKKENLILSINDASKASDDLEKTGKTTTELEEQSDQNNKVEYLTLLENASTAYSKLIESFDDAGIYVSILDSIKNKIKKINNSISFISLLQNCNSEKDEIYAIKIKELEYIINNGNLEDIDNFLNDEFNDLKYFELTGGDLFIYYILTKRKMLDGVPNLPVGNSFREILRFEDERISVLNVEKKIISGGDSYSNIINIIKKNKENILRNVKTIDYINFFRELNSIRLNKSGMVYNYVRLSLLLNEIEQEFAA